MANEEKKNRRFRERQQISPVDNFPPLPTFGFEFRLGTLWMLHLGQTLRERPVCVACDV